MPRRRQFILFQRFQSFQFVLVEHDHQSQPHQHARQHVQGCVDQRQVARAAEHAEDQQADADHDLHQQADAGHLGRSLVGEMVGSHDSEITGMKEGAGDARA